jgi:hypothetical protein
MLFTMKTKLFACLTLVMTAHTCSAAGWSLLERGYLKSIPAIYREHKTGPLVAPSDDDVKEAISFGEASKEKPEALAYAYLLKRKASMLGSDSIYVTVSTPLELIARHSQEQAKEFRATDSDFVSYARRLKCIRISVTQQWLSSGYTALAANRELIILRDGKRVENLGTVEAWKGANPFLANNKSSLSSDATVNAIQQQAIAQTRAIWNGADESTRKQLLAVYTAQGRSDAQIMLFTGATAEELSRMRGKTVEAAETGPTMLLLQSEDGVFAIEELIKPGKYELVFRQPNYGAFTGVGDKEIRVPIEFTSFR